MQVGLLLTGRGNSAFSGVRGDEVRHEIGKLNYGVWTGGKYSWVVTLEAFMCAWHTTVLLSLDYGTLECTLVASIIAIR